MPVLGRQLRVPSWLKKAKRLEIMEAMRPGTGRLRIAIDCGLDTQLERKRQMSDKELFSLSMQLLLSHSSNHKVPRPCHLHLVGLTSGGRIETAFTQNISNYSSMLVTKTNQPPDMYFHGNDIVYLSPDSTEELETVSADCVYVVGGVVDKTVDKYLAEKYADRVLLRTARLPIHQHMKLLHHVNLPLNIVVDILLSVYNGASWREAFEQFIPQRKRL